MHARIVFFYKEIFLLIKRVQTWRKVPKFIITDLPILSGFESIYIYICVYLGVDLSLIILEYLENLNFFVHVSSYVCPDSVK